MISITKNSIIARSTRSFIEEYDDIDLDDYENINFIEKKLLEITNKNIELHNLGEPDTNIPENAEGRYPNKKTGLNKLRELKELVPYQIAHILKKYYSIVRIAATGLQANPDNDILAIYKKDEGIYSFSDDDIRKVARKFNITMNVNEYKEVILILRDITSRKEINRDENLIAVNNGIFDYKTKELYPFSEDYIFTSKSAVDYKENAINPVIKTPDNDEWDVVSWMHSLSDDEEIVELLWQILGAVIRPNVNWDKAAWFYSEQGSNGKGTLCTLMRNLCGSSASIPLKDFSKDFMLEPLTQASAIIVDENNVGTYIDEAANIKAIITKDIITINRKFKPALIYRFSGFMVQCLNELPRIKDKSNSFFRRQLFVPFEKTFTGKERKYIKSDYLYRKDVLEFVLNKILNTNYYTLSEPEACRLALEDYKEFNDPVKYFYNSVIELELKWDLLPFKFLYDLYKKWYQDVQPASGSVVGYRVFVKDIKEYVKNSDKFYYEDKLTRSANRMTYPEPLIIEYNLTNWMNDYKGADKYKKSIHDSDKVYRGLMRYK